MSECIFCRMIEGEIEPDVVMETERVLAFRDINPQAPIHILVVPKDHIATVNDVADGHGDLMGELFLVARDIARDQGFAGEGYRTVMNCQEEAGQSVFHIHLHLLAGRRMHWPPG